MKILMMIILSAFLVSCSHESKKTGSKIITVQQKEFANNLFYTGTVKPLKTVVVTCPADGVVIEMPFQYGEAIKSNQLLFMLSSTKFLSDYKNALMQYIKAKSDFNTNETQLSEANFLHKNELISDDDFKMKQANYYGAQLAFLQAKDALESLIIQMNMKDANLYKLSISDIDKITNALHLKGNAENLRIIAPVDGIVLSPSKNEEESKKIVNGDTVKQGDVLAIIGDVNGISVQIKINELTVNQIKLGQPVTVTGIAFPDQSLQGKISRLDKQGDATNNGLPTFTAEVVVPYLTEEQKKEIHVGMSAKVEINIVEDSQMMVPIAALKEKQGVSYVQIVDEKNKRTQNVAVKTGKTTMDLVAILSGVKSGDKIVIPD